MIGPSTEERAADARPPTPPPPREPAPASGPPARRRLLALAIALAVAAAAVFTWTVTRPDPREPEPPPDAPRDTVPERDVPEARPFAGPGTTGHEADVPGLHVPARLTVHEGDYRTSSNGETISGLDIQGVLRVRHAGVVVEDTRADAVDVDVEQYPDASVELRWSTIGEPAGRDASHNAVGRGNFTVFRCELFGAVDLVKVQGGVAEVRESWLHSGYEWPSDPGQDGERAHVDFVQTTLVQDVTRLAVVANAFDVWVFGPDQRPADVWRDPEASRTATGAVSLFQHENDHRILEATVSGNVFRGDVYSWFYVTHDPDDPPPAGVVFADNVLDPEGAERAVITADSPDALVWEGNADFDGEEVASG